MASSEGGEYLLNGGETFVGGMCCQIDKDVFFNLLVFHLFACVFFAVRLPLSATIKVPLHKNCQVYSTLFHFNDHATEVGGILFSMQCSKNRWCHCEKCGLKHITNISTDVE